MPHNGRDYLNAVGIGELITPNLLDYVSQAIYLAKSPDKLVEYRTRLVESREKSLIFDNDKYCKNFENLLNTIWNKHIEDDPPASFCVLGSEFGLN
jgi:predicted O-linked N-acetylglucosamine transferase (SPINDLY family)